MLTKSDFDQIGKLVRKIVREEVETEVANIKDSVEHEIRTANLHLRNAIHEQGDRIKNVEIRLSSVEKEIKGSRKDIRKLQINFSQLKLSGGFQAIHAARWDYYHNHSFPSFLHAGRLPHQ